MATTNQRNRSGGQEGGNERKIRRAASRAVNKLSDMRDDVGDYMSHGAERFGQLTRSHEGQAAMIALAAGFGIGFVIGCSLATANRRPHTWRRRMAEGFGRTFMDRVESILPEMISEHLHR